MDSTVITLAPSTASQVHDWLRHRVLRGELPPGARLSETEIASEIGVSRQPVREAFIRLAGDGLAEIRPQRGTYISKISMSAVLSARLIREAVEGDLARLTAGLRPPAALASTAVVSIVHSACASRARSARSVGSPSGSVASMLTCRASASMATAASATLPDLPMSSAHSPASADSALE